VGASAAHGRGGCLAEWDGRRWALVDRAAFAEISNLGSMSEAVLAAGWDRASALVKLRGRDGRWTTCRLPKAAHQDDCAPGGLCGGGRPRVREVVTERMLMDLGGLMYEVSGLTYAWSIRPVTAHRRAISDFCSWRGLLVLAGADADAACDANYLRSGPGCGLWFGMTDDLWQLGKPAGVGGPWRETAVRAGEPSAPYLMADFETKRVELSSTPPSRCSSPLRLTPRSSAGTGSRTQPSPCRPARRSTTPSRPASPPTGSASASTATAPPPPGSFMSEGRASRTLGRAGCHWRPASASPSARVGQNRSLTSCWLPDRLRRARRPAG
jgi:hypothetical protein